MSSTTAAVSCHQLKEDSNIIQTQYLNMLCKIFAIQMHVNQGILRSVLRGPIAVNNLSQRKAEAQ